MSRISIIVPVYRVEAYLHRCVDSILVQTFSDFELILVDDGSPDNSGIICDEYARQDSRIHVIHQKNGGLSAARNAGIDWAFAQSDSQWLTFIDSDDWVHPKYLEVLMHGAETTNLQVIIGGYEQTTGQNPTVLESDFNVEVWDTDEFYYKKVVNATVAWGKLYDKECFNQIRYPLGKNQEDEFVTYKILFRYQQIAFIDTPLYAYFINSNGIMHNLRKQDILYGLEAQQERLDFFSALGKEKLYQRQVREYIRSIAVIIQSTEIYQFQKNEISDLKATLNKMLKNREIRRTFPFSDETAWVYKIIHPYKVAFYYKIVAVLKKLKNMSP